MDPNSVDALLARREARGPAHHEAPAPVVLAQPKPLPGMASIRANGEVIIQIDEHGNVNAKQGVDQKILFQAIYAALAPKQMAQGVAGEPSNLAGLHCLVCMGTDPVDLVPMVEGAAIHVHEHCREEAGKGPGLYYAAMADSMALPENRAALVPALIDRDLCLLALHKVSKGKGGVVIAKSMLAHVSRKVADIPIELEAVAK